MPVSRVTQNVLFCVVQEPARVCDTSASQGLAPRPAGDIDSESPPCQGPAADTWCPHCLNPTGKGLDFDDELTKSAHGQQARFAAKTRLRRSRRNKRTQNKAGLWWKKFGYCGPAYCQRCSEVFRDHILRGNSNSAQCSLRNPCNDCGKVLKCMNRGLLKKGIAEKYKR